MSAIKKLLGPPYRFVSRSFFDPLPLFRKVRGIPHFARNLARYSRANERGTFRFRLRDLWYRSYDRFDSAGSLEFHYFWQDLWAAQRLFDSQTREHVDVASRVDGFIAHLLPFCHVTYVDLRPIDLPWKTFTNKRGLITEMPFENDSVPSLSSLHVIEHVGLGRYGDPVDPEGYLRAAEELVRVLAPGGRLILGTPVGKEALYFDAHRVFDPQTIRDAFGKLELEEFSLIDDANKLTLNASFDVARTCSMGCGLFVFRKGTA